MIRPGSTLWSPANKRAQAEGGQVLLVSVVARRGERGPLKAGYRPAFRSAAVACAAGWPAWAAAWRSVSAFSSAPISIASPVR